MPTHTEMADPDEKSERAPLAKPGGAVVASPRACEVCGAALTGRPQQKCCSGRCRAAKSRKARAVELADLEDQAARLVTRLRALQRKSYA
jgi:hypothetical protein